MSNFLKSILGIKKSPKVIKSKMQTRRLELIGLEERITPATFSTDAAGLITVQLAAGESLTAISATVAPFVTTITAVVTVNVTSSTAANTLIVPGAGTSGLVLTTNGGAGAASVITYTSANNTAGAGLFTGISILGSSGAETVAISGAVDLLTTNPAANASFNVGTNVEILNVNAAVTAKGAVGVTLNAGAVNFNSSGNINTTAGNVSVTGTGSVTTAGNTITTTTGSSTITGSINGGTSALTINSTSGAVSLGAITALGALSITTTGTIGLTGAVTAASVTTVGAGVVTLGGAVNTTGATTFGGNVDGTNTSVSSTAGDVTFAGTVGSIGTIGISVDATHFINIANAVSAGAGSNITITGTVKATSTGSSSINATAAGTITITGGIDNASANNNDIGIFSVNGAITVTGDIKGGDDVTIFSSGTGNVILNGLISNQSAGGAILIYSQGGGNVTIDKAISTVGATSVISLGNSTSTGTGILTASGTLTSAGSVSLNSGASSTVILAGAVASVGDVSDNGVGKLSLGSTIITTGGNIILDNLATTLTAAVSLKTLGTGSDITLASVNGAQNLTLEAVDVITLTSVGKGNSLSTVTVTNSNGVSVGTFSAAKVVLTDTTGTIAFGGSTVITTSLTTAAKAYSVSFAGTSVLSGAPVFLNTGNVSFNGTTSLTTGATITGNAATTVDLAGTIVSGGAFNIGALPLTTTIADGTQLTLNSTTAASTIANFITLTGPATAGTATLSLLGVGTLTLSGDSSTGITTGDSINVINCTLNVTGKIGAASTSTVNGGTLGGSGTLGNVTFNSGTLAPGNSPGTLTTGSIALSPQTTFAVEIGTTSTASDLLIATGGTAGGVTLSNAILSVISVAAGVKIGDSFTIVNAINTTVISGTFAGLPEGGTITGLDTLGSTVTFRISYPNNQAVQLKVVALVPAPQDAVFTNGTVVATDALKKFTAVGTDAGGGPLVTITFATGRKIQFFAYAESFRGGVRVALGNVDGGTDTELVTGPGAGGGPQVNVWKINVFTGIVTLQSSFFAFSEPSFTGGVYVAAGDTNGNGFDDVIIGAGKTGGSRVQVYAGSATGVVTTSTLNDFFAYSPAFTGGVVVAAGDRNADGDDEIITAPASGGGYNIKSFDGNGTGNSPTVVDNFFAFNNTTSIGGLSLAAGFLNSGNISDLVIGTSNGGYGVIIDFATAGITTVPFAGFTGAIRAGVAEDNIGQDFAVALAGPGGGPILNTYSVISNNLVVNDSLFILDPAFQGGLFGTPTL
jgi:hypothetical protein